MTEEQAPVLPIKLDDDYVPADPGAYSVAAAEDETKSLGLFSQEKRTEEIKNAIHSVIVWSIRILAIAMFIGLGVRLFHLFAPEWMTWLKATQLKEIDTLLLGVFGGLLGRFFPGMFPSKK
jgi:hypothetical protein